MPARCRRLAEQVLVPPGVDFPTDGRMRDDAIQRPVVEPLMVGEIGAFATPALSESIDFGVRHATLA
jgi:hypothetical protein